MGGGTDGIERYLHGLSPKYCYCVCMCASACLYQDGTYHRVAAAAAAAASARVRDDRPVFNVRRLRRMDGLVDGCADG